jgi:hypothetical protein
LRVPGDPQHARHARSVNVRIQHADTRPVRAQREREIDRRGRLAHAALAGGHRNDVLDLVQRLEFALHRMRHDLPLEADRGALDQAVRLQDRRDLRQALLFHAIQRVPGAQLDRYAAAVDTDAPQPAQLDKVGPGHRIDDARQQFFHMLLGEICHAVRSLGYALPIRRHIVYFFALDREPRS